MDPRVARTHFFAESGEDDRLEHRNLHFWRALIGHVRADGVESAASILDYGSHTGGLLSLAVEQFKPDRVWGMEPLLRSRQQAALRLRGHAVQARMLSANEWAELPDGAVDLLLSHEVLYLVEDLALVFREFARVLRRQCAAYVVLGCHTENPLWPAWKAELVNMGHEPCDHSPFDLLRAGAEAGLSPSLRPLRDTGWVHFDPRTPGFSFPTAQTLLDHQYRHKLVFRFIKP